MSELDPERMKQWQARVSLFKSSSHPSMHCYLCQAPSARWHYVFGFGRCSLSDVLECEACGAFVTRADLEGRW